jgi:hypothetical protein
MVSLNQSSNTQGHSNKQNLLAIMEAKKRFSTDSERFELRRQLLLTILTNLVEYAAKDRQRSLVTETNVRS